MKLKLSSGLFNVDQLSNKEVENILDKSNFFKKRFVGNAKAQTGNKNINIINIFLEPSTRTRLSFELAAYGSGYNISNFSDNSATKKGESLIDTITTLDAMGFDIMIIRAGENGLPYKLSQYCSAAIINAGDGTNEHPTQALVDLYTIKEHKIEPGSTIAIVGDLLHSRVAKSNTKLLAKMGYRIVLVSPKFWSPNLNHWGLLEYKDSIQFSESIEAIKEADAVMALRIQEERQLKAHTINLREYNQTYGIKTSRIRDGQILMHPGPVCRGVEIDDDVLYGPRSVILEQAKNGASVRAAILEEIIKNIKR